MTTVAELSDEVGFGRPVSHARTVSGKKRKRGMPKSYPSNIQGQRIVNAMTGTVYDYRVGSKDETRLFKVATSQPFKKHVDLLGEEVIDADGYQMNTLFYDNPEQYEKHRFLTLSDELKMSWYESHPWAERTIEKEADDPDA